MPPSLSHFQPGLNFDPASGYMYCPDLLEALRRGAHNFEPRHEEHLRQQEKSPVRASAQICSGPLRLERERPVLSDGARIQNVLKVHFKPAEIRGDRRTSATCLSVLRCALAGVRRCGSSLLGTEGAVRRSPENTS